MDRTKHREQPLPAREVLEYLEVPLRRPLHLCLPLVLFVSAALVASYTLPKLYRSSTLIIVERETVPDGFVRKATTENGREQLATIKQQILSRTRLEKIIRELDPYPEKMGKQPITQIVEGMRQNIAITVKGLDAFSIDFIHPDPRKAMAVANRLGTLFIEAVVEEREEQVEGVHEFIEAQLDDARRELEVKEEALRKFKERHMGTLPTQMDANLSTLQRLQLEHQNVGELLRAAQDRQALLERGLVDQLAAAGSRGSVVLGPAAELAQLKGQLQSLRGRYTEEHPDVRALLARIDRMERALSDAPATPEPAAGPSMAGSQVQQRTSAEISALVAKRENLEQRIAEFQARVEQVPRTEQQLATLTRDYNKLHENYLALLNKKLEAQMAERLEKRWKGQNFRILDPADLPESPFSPNRPLLLTAGILLGLIAGLGASVGAELLDHSIKNVRELETVLPYPILATVPHIPDSQPPLAGASVADAAREL
jgi:polysaccharide chain length determinant protein (PEP-CTERM system associated)